MVTRKGKDLAGGCRHYSDGAADLKDENNSHHTIGSGHGSRSVMDGWDEEETTGWVEDILYVAHIVQQGDEHHKPKAVINQYGRNHTPGNDQVSVLGFLG